MKPNTIFNIPFYIDGIPCQIGVQGYSGQAPHQGSPWTCDSDMDYYGFEDIEYIILDKKGYHAKWLETKLTDPIREDIESIISNSIKEDEYEEDDGYRDDGGYYDDPADDYYNP